jgi:hypothetical protein
VNYKTLAVFLSLLSLSGAAYAKDLTGVLGLSYSLGPSFLVGGSEARDVGQTVGPGVGAALELGLFRGVSFQFGYDYIDHSLQAQDMMFSGIYRFMPEKQTTPFAGFGLGFGKRYAGDDWDRFALKMQFGAEHFVTDNIAFAGFFNYSYINGPHNNGRDIGSLHMIEPGVRVAYYFGKIGAWGR